MYIYIYIYIYICMYIYIYIYIYICIYSVGQVTFKKYLSTSTSTSHKNLLEYKYFTRKSTLSIFGT